MNQETNIEKLLEEIDKRIKLVEDDTNTVYKTVLELTTNYAKSLIERKGRITDIKEALLHGLNTVKDYLDYRMNY